MINYPRVSLVYDRYKKASSARKASIEIRISYNRKQKYISTGIKVLPSQWKGGRIINTEDNLMLNMELDNLLNNVRKALYSMYEEGDVNIFDVVNHLRRTQAPDLLGYFKQRAKMRKYNKAKATQSRYDRFIRAFMEWKGIKSFRDINDKNIIAYDKHLSSRGLKASSKWHNYHRFLNSFIVDAIEDGYLSRNPYKWVNIEKGDDGNSITKHLSQEEFYRIKTAKLPTKCLERVRDIFVFQTYTCMSYTDLRNFDSGKIIIIKGTKVYTGKRDKTGKDFTIPLLNPALKILAKYDNDLKFRI